MGCKKIVTAVSGVTAYCALVASIVFLESKPELDWLQLILFLVLILCFAPYVLRLSRLGEGSADHRREAKTLRFWLVVGVISWCLVFLSRLALFVLHRFYAE